ncbi:MAG: hypothetical protein ACLVF9_01305 [Enterocloster sp.]
MAEKGKAFAKTSGVPLTSIPAYGMFKRDLRLLYTDFTNIMNFYKKGVIGCMDGGSNGDWHRKNRIGSMRFME